VIGSVEVRRVDPVERVMHVADDSQLHGSRGLGVARARRRSPPGRRRVRACG
jgi:hypothetical protein